jgi:hypothetical protein
MVKCGVLFEVRTEFLNSIWTSFGFKGLSACGRDEAPYGHFASKVLLRKETGQLIVVVQSIIQGPDGMGVRFSAAAEVYLCSFPSSLMPRKSQFIVL